MGIFFASFGQKNIWAPCEILLQRNTMAGHKRITFQVRWHIYRYTQEIRRYVWKLRMKRWMIKAHQRKCPLQRQYFKSKIRSQARYVQSLKKNLDFREGGSVHCFLSVSDVFVTISVAFPVQISLFWYGAKMLLIYTCRCEGGKASYLTTSLFIVQFCRDIF